MWRRSSPTEELRWSADSTAGPRRLLLRSPFIRPTKILRLTSSSCSSLWRNSGSSRGGAGGGGIAGARRGGGRWRAASRSPGGGGRIAGTDHGSQIPDSGFQDFEGGRPAENRRGSTD